MIQNYPVLFTEEQISKIETLKSAKYVCSTEQKGLSVEVFYADNPHPVSGSRYFALYRAGDTRELMITDGSFIEDQVIEAVITKNGDIIYSRYRHDYRVSADGTDFIDGGRAYVRTNVLDPTRRRILTVRDGILQVKEDA